MVWPLQDDRAGPGRNSEGKSGRGEGSEGERRRQPQFVGALQCPRHSDLALLQGWAVTRPGDRDDEQEGPAQPARSPRLTSIAGCFGNRAGIWFSARWSLLPALGFESFSSLPNAF